MDIVFKDKKTKKVFSSDKLLKKEYGIQNAKAIRRRMTVLQSANNLELVPKIKPERCHPLSGNKDGQFAVDVKHPFRLVFEIEQEPIPLKSDKGVDLSKVTSIKILKIEDYH